MADMWYYTSEGKQMEPVSGSELKQLAAKGLLKPTDMVWKEGMAKWVRASSAKGLFPEDGMMAMAPKTLPAPTKKAAFRKDDDEDEPQRDRPRREKRRDPDESDEREERGSRDDLDNDDEPPRRRRRRQEGMSTGAKVAILGGSAVLLVGLVIAAIILLNKGGDGAVAGGNNNAQPAPGAGNVVANYTVNLAVDGEDARSFGCKAGTKYLFVAVSNNRGGDVDLFVLNNNEQEQAFDDSIGPDSRVEWIAPYTGSMRVEVVNLGPGANRTTVTIREIGQGPVPQVPNVPPFGKGPDFKGPNNGPPGARPAPFMGPVNVGAGGFSHAGTIGLNDPRDAGRLCKVYSVNMTAGKSYTIRLERTNQGFDPLLRVEDANNNTIAEDDDSGGNLNSQINFVPQQNGAFRVIVSDLGGLPGPYMLRITER